MELFLRDVHHYFYNVEHSPRPGQTYRVRDELRRRFLAVVRKAQAYRRPRIVLCHSMGTIIAYDCLRNVPECPPIDGIITLGSPLGLDEVQEMLKPPGTRRVDFPAAKLHGQWLNVYDPL